MNSRPELLGELTTEQFRQKLAGLRDVQGQVEPQRKQDMRELAINFVAALPQVYGESLDRMALWDRIGSGLQTAFAKTAGSDCEFFIQQVLDHIKAEPSKAVSNETIGATLLELQKLPDVDRQSWVAQFNSHLIPIMVHARGTWGDMKTARKAKADKPSPLFEEGGEA